MIGSRITFVFIIFLYIFNLYSSKFLILPLKSLKRKNNDLPFNDKSIQQYLVKDFSPINFIENWYLRTITTELTIGSPAKNYKVDILANFSKLQCTNDDRFQQRINQNLFNISKTYKNTSDVTVYKNFEKITIAGYLSDTFQLQFSDDLSTRKTKMQSKEMEFYLNEKFIDNVTKKEDIDYKTLNFTNNFIFGIQISTEYETNKTGNLLQNLKSADIIESYDFCVEYYDNVKPNPNTEDDEVGRLVIGKFPQIYDKEKYLDENLRITKLQNDYTEIKYLVYMTNISLLCSNGTQDVFENDEQIEFVFDSTLFNAPYMYRDHIVKEFFEKYEDGKMCEELKGEGADRTKLNNFTMFVCKKDLISKHKNDFPILQFYSKDLNYTFEFGYDDMFREYMGKVYFMAIFPQYKYHYRNWEVGKIFLKKYQLFFNVDSKLLRFYAGPVIKPKKPNVAKKVVIIILEILFAAVLICLAYYYGKKWNNKRKLRASELEDTYEYVEASNRRINNIELGK